MFYEGQKLGEYILIEKLGRGGFGEVWLAEYEDDFFALKLPHKDQVDWKSITQEIGLWTLCGKHPNVMPLISARNFNGQIAIISEYASDGSLEDLLKQKGKLSVDESVEITIGILEGLQHLHESGVIHRDLKPANILIDGKTPRLTDFGISRIISADSLSETVSGTWAYMAPECFDGKRNIQTDIWSVGVILYFLLSGKLPFPQKEPTELMFAIVMKEFEPLLESVPLKLRNIVSKSLAKDSTVRYQVTSQMRQDLQSLLTPFQQVQIKDLNETIVDETLTVLDKKESDTRLIPYRKGNKWGMSDLNKTILIEPKYENMHPLYDEKTAVKLDNYWGIIDIKGQEVTPLKYSVLVPFKDTTLFRLSNGKYGFINKKGQEFTFPTKYDYLGGFDNDISSVRIDKKWGYIDKTGYEIIPLIYDYAFGFSEGLGSVVLNNKSGFVDKTGHKIIPLIYDRVELFREGLALVCLNSKWKFIDKIGQDVVLLEYDIAASFYEGLALVGLKKKWGFIDKAGQEIIPLRYGGSFPFQEGLAGCGLNYKWGFIDKVGQEIIPLRYDRVHPFNNNLGAVSLDKKWGFIDKTGKIVIPLKFDKLCDNFLTHFQSGITRVELEGKEGYIGKDGTEYFED